MCEALVNFEYEILYGVGAFYIRKFHDFFIFFDLIFFLTKKRR